MTLRTPETLFTLLPLVLASAAMAAGDVAAVGTPKATSQDVIHGRYVEARTASVFAGACHYNGERVTDGRAAVMAWAIDGGVSGGVDVAGVRVLAAVTADTNLADAGPRKSELVVDAPTDAAAAAAVAWVKSQCDAGLGSVLGVRRAAVSFKTAAGVTSAFVTDFASVAMRPMPDAACCSQPNLVWYKPVSPLLDRRVGYTIAASHAAGPSGDAWQRADENGAIYGHFGPAVDTATLFAVR